VHFAKADTFLKCIRVFSVEEKRKASDLLLNGLRTSGYDLKLVISPVVSDDLDRAPCVLLVDVHGGKSVRLIGSLGAVVDPLLDGAVLFPGIVAGQYLDSGHLGIPEDFILFLEDGDGFFGSDVLLADLLLLVVFR